MKVFQKYRGFGRYLLSYLCVLLLPLTVFLLFSSHFYLNVYRNEVIRQNQMNLERLRDDFDGQIIQLVAIAGQISTQDSTSERHLQTNVTAYEDLRKILQGYTATHPFLENAAFYTSATPDTVYTAFGTFNVDLFRHYKWNGQNFDLLERLEQAPFQPWWQPEHMYWPQSDQRSVLEYAVAVPDLPGGYMLFTFSEQSLSGITVSPDSSTAIYDANLRLLFPSGPADEAAVDALSVQTDEESGYILLEDDRYLLTCCSRATGLIYARTISRSVMLEPVTSFQRLFTILIVVLALVGGAVVYAFSMLSYQPIRRLDRLTARLPVEVPENLHGVERAGFVIERLDERYESLEKEARREKQLYRLVHSRRSSEECEDALAKAGICFSSRFLRVILLFLEPGKEGWEPLDVLDTVDQILSGQYETAGMEYLENNCYLFILGYEEENEELLCSKLMTVASCFGGCTAGKFRITVGGPARELSEVSQSYTQALMAAKVTDSAKTIHFFDGPSMGKVRFLYPKIELDALYNAVVNADGDKVKLISDILIDMVRVNARNSFVASSLSCDIINTFLRGLEELKPDVGGNGYYARFASLCDPSDIRSYLDAIGEIRDEVSSIIGSKPSEAAQDDAISRMLAFINENCENEDLCVSYVAEHFELSMSNLSHQFKALTGRNISDYIAEKKMQFAKKLLRTTDIPISEVALRLGYNQTSSFIRKFKQCENRTPNEYRVACRDSDGENRKGTP